MPLPAYYKPTITSHKRRAPWHNYYGRGTYMVPFNKERSCPDFSILEYARSETACSTMTGLGLILQEQIEITPRFSSEIRIHDYVIMPDHVHILIEVTQPMPRHLGDVIQAIKSASTSRIRKHTGDQNLIAFEEGFHDRIIFDKKQFETARRYIHDNPRRLAIRCDNPDYFRRVSCLIIDGYECRAYGNLQLLDNPFKEQVILHRADNNAERGRNRERWLYTAANGGVLVSPFISPAEKAIREEAEECGGNFIILTNDTMGERYKPAGRDFELCTEGRLLIISAGLPQTRVISRATCLALNAMAAAVARH